MLFNICPALDLINQKTRNDRQHMVKMKYDIPHFMGYRFALFNYATKNTGGYVDFDFFHVTDTIQ